MAEIGVNAERTTSATEPGGAGTPAVVTTVLNCLFDPCHPSFIAKEAGKAPASLRQDHQHITLTAWRHISSGIVLMAIVARSRNAHAVTRENDPDGAEVRPAIKVLICLQNAVASIEK